MFWGLVLNALRLFIRQKISLALVLVLAVVLPGISYFLFTADGTLTGVLKIMFGWQFYLCSGLLMLLTIYLASSALDDEARNFQLLLVAVKPAPRWAILTAKFVAIGLLVGGIIVLSGISSYVALRARTTPENILRIRQASTDTVRLSEAQLKLDAEAQRQITRRDFFASRRTRYPVIPDLLAEINANIEELKASGRLEAAPSDKEIATAVRRIMSTKNFPIPYGAAKDFHFVGLQPTHDGLTFRYKIDGTQRTAELGWLHAGFQFFGAEGLAPYRREESFRRQVQQEFLVPGDLIDANGNLDLFLYNLSGPTEKSPEAEIGVPFDGLQLLTPAGSFEINFVRAWLLLWVRLCLLAALGVGMSALVGAPINLFFLIAVLFVGSLNSSLHATYNPAPSPYQADFQRTAADEAKRYAVLVLSFLPDFAQTDPVDKINQGEEIEWQELALQFCRDVLVRGGIILLLGYLVFLRRELAIYRGN
jgi:hypothetical protein